MTTAHSTRVPADFNLATLIIKDSGRLAVMLVVLNVLLPLCLAISAILAGKDAWAVFEGERNVITWYSSIQLMLIAGLAYCNFEFALAAGRAASLRAKARQWVWLVFALGFVFLSLDERFEIHEQLRDRFLKPADIVPTLSWLRAGDVVMYFYLLCGLGAAVFLFSDLKRSGTAVATFVGAVVLSALFAVIDSLNPDIVAGWVAASFWNSAFEEVVELWAQALFALSFIIVLRKRLATACVPSVA